MSGLAILKNLLLKEAAIESGKRSGIAQIGNVTRDIAEKKFQAFVIGAKRQGVDLDKYTEQELKYIIEMNKSKPPKVISQRDPEFRKITEAMLGGKEGKVIKADFGKPFAEEMVTPVERVITDIKKMKPMDSMKEANKVLKGEGRYKNLSQADREKIVNDESVTDHIFERQKPRDADDPNYDAEPADFDPDADNETFAEGGRIGFSAGSGRRAFLKLMATLGGGIAGLKSGLFRMGGKEAGKKAVTETVKQSVGSGQPPAYFFKLVDKIKTMGDDVTSKSANQPREKVTQYKDYELTEDLTTGEQTIQKFKLDGDNPYYYDEVLAEETYMNYKPGKGQADETTGKVADEYIEDTSYLRTSGPDKGEIVDTVDGVSDDVIKEGTMFEDNMTEFGKTKKAEGGIAGMLGE